MPPLAVWPDGHGYGIVCLGARPILVFVVALEHQKRLQRAKYVGASAVVDPKVKNDTFGGTDAANGSRSFGEVSGGLIKASPDSSADVLIRVAVINVKRIHDLVLGQTPFEGFCSKTMGVDKRKVIQIARRRRKALNIDAKVGDMGCFDTWCLLCGAPLGGYARDPADLRQEIKDEMGSGETPEFQRRYVAERKLREAAAWTSRITAVVSTGEVVHGLEEVACNGQFQTPARPGLTYGWPKVDMHWIQKEKRYVFGPEASVPMHTDCLIFAGKQGVQFRFDKLVAILAGRELSLSGMELPDKISYGPVSRYHSQSFDYEAAGSRKLWEHPADWYVVFSPLNTTPQDVGAANRVKKNQSRILRTIRQVVALAESPPKRSLEYLSKSPTEHKRGPLQKKTPPKKPAKASKKVPKKVSAKKPAKVPKQAVGRSERPSPVESATQYPVGTRRKKNNETFEVISYVRQGKRVKRWKRL